MTPYRTPDWSPPRPELEAFALNVRAYDGKIGDCEVTIERVDSHGTRWRWRVSRDLMIFQGCARYVADAFDAAERAADVIANWPAELIGAIALQ